jgi:ParB-like chromosome segregation protein Spo0J
MSDNPARILPALADRAVPIDSVKPHPENYNRHDIDSIAESLKLNGQYRAIVVDHSTGHILAGNGTWAAARRLRWATIAADRVDVDEATARRILLVDNFAATQEYDTQGVVDILRDLDGDLSGTGISADDFASMLKKLEPPDEDAGSKLADSYGFSVIVEADDEHHQAELLDRFAQEGLTCRAFTL